MRMHAYARTHAHMRLLLLCLVCASVRVGARAQVTRASMLNKRVGGVSGWKERWVTLGERALAQYKSLKDRAPAALVHLEPDSVVTVLAADKNPPFSFMVEKHHGSAGTQRSAAQRNRERERVVRARGAGGYAEECGTERSQRARSSCAEHVH